ncbi:Protein DETOXIFICATION 42 [Linum perenne]
MDKKLAGWKANNLSLAGRVTLASSVLNAIPSFVMQTAFLPVHVCEAIDKKVRDFIWGSVQGGRKIHNINWETVCKPKSLGGMGLRSARDLNRAFLMKIVWGLVSRPTELWAKVLISKYLKKTDNGFVLARKKGFSAIWRRVLKVWPLVSNGLHWSIRNGRNTHFWTDRWVDSGILLADHAMDTRRVESSLLVAQVCSDSGAWNVDFLLAVLPYNIVMQVVGMTPPSSTLGDDSLVWGLEPNGVFSVRSAYLMITDNAATPTDSVWRHHATNSFLMEVIIRPLRSRNNVSFGSTLYSRPGTNQLGREASGKARQTQLIAWRPGNEGWSTLNTDGSRYTHSGSTAIGGLIRDDGGRFVRAFTANIGDCSITRAELSAIVQGLRLAWTIGIRKIIVQSDSQTAVGRGTFAAKNLYSLDVDCKPSEAQHSLFSTQGGEEDRLKMRVQYLFSRSTFRKDELGLEIMEIAVPAALALAADPIASLIDTAFIGQLGPVELAAVGVSIAVFNQVSKIAIFPIVSVTTSLVAEEDAIAEERQGNVELGDAASISKEVEELLPKTDESRNGKGCFEKRHIPSASSAMVVSCVLGVIQALCLILAAEPVLNYMGVHKAKSYYLICTSAVVGDAMNIVLDPIFIFVFRLNVSGAAIAHVISQYVISIILLWNLVQEVDLLPPSIKELQLGRFLKSGFMLLMRVIAATFCVTLAASLAARHGPTSMAAFQVCLQIWLAASLLADGLAVAGQAILASAFAKKDYERAVETASRVLQYGLVLGLALAAILLPGLHFGARLFTRDESVLRMINIGVPFVAVTQPVNVMAFVFDGVNYGASDFTYSAYSMVIVSIVSILCLFTLSSSHGFVGIWVALTIFMALRALAGFLRIGVGMGPWRFLKMQA